MSKIGFKLSSSESPDEEIKFGGLDDLPPHIREALLKKLSQSKDDDPDEEQGHKRSRPSGPVPTVFRCVTSALWITTIYSLLSMVAHNQPHINSTWYWAWGIPFGITLSILWLALVALALPLARAAFQLFLTYATLVTGIFIFVAIGLQVPFVGILDGVLTIAGLVTIWRYI